MCPGFCFLRLRALFLGCGPIALASRESASKLAHIQKIITPVPPPLPLETEGNKGCGGSPNLSLTLLRVINAEIKQKRFHGLLTSFVVVVFLEQSWNLLFLFSLHASRKKNCPFFKSNGNYDFFSRL